MTTLAAVPALSLSADRREAAAFRKGVRLELTRRGRIVRALLLLLVVLAVLFAVLSQTGASSAVADWVGGPDLVSVTVQPGDTLWEYAGTYAPEGTDPRDWVIDVQRANGLASAELTAGTQIEVPAGR